MTGAALPERRDREPAQTERMLLLVYFIYFFCGMTQSFEGSVLPEMKTYFHLGYQQQMYAIFAKNIPFLMAPLLGSLALRLGYGRVLAMAMALYAAGTLLLVPGLQSGMYALMLAGFVVLGSGFTLQMIAGNPLITMLGRPLTSSSRLQLGNALGAAAQIIAPALLSLLIPGATASIAQRIAPVEHLLVVLGCMLAAVCAVTFLLARRTAHGGVVSEQHDAESLIDGSAWQDRELLLAAAMLFLLLGAEASLFSFFRNFLEDGGVAGLMAHSSQRLFTAYFASFALGRLSASWLQRFVQPSRHLVLSVAGALVLAIAAVVVHGRTAVAVMLALGFVVSTLFPTLYDIALRRAGALKAQAAGMLTFGFLGSALLPLLQGRVADRVGLQHSYLCVAAVYLVLLLYSVALARDEARV